jgi:hypothetical protein
MLKSLKEYHKKTVSFLLPIVVFLLSLTPANARAADCFTLTTSGASTVLSAGTSCTGSLNIPEGVTEIANNAFDQYPGYAAGLTSVTFPSTLKILGNYVFRGNPLTSLSIPKSITSYNGTTFQSISSATTLSIDASLTYVPGFAFQYYSGMTSLTLSDSITSIGDYAFFGTSRLQTLVIPNSVTSIGSEAFTNSGLRNVTMSSNISSFSNFPLSQLTNITYCGPSTSTFAIALRAASKTWNCPVQFGGISKSSGNVAGGDRFTVTGSGFSDLMSVSISGNPVSIVVDSSTSFTGISPAGPPGAANMLIFKSLADSTTVTNAFTYTVDARNTAEIGETSTVINDVAGTFGRPKLFFSGLTAPATVVVSTASNPVASTSSPFKAGSLIVDLSVSGISGPVTLCLDGNSTDGLWHFEGGSWVDIKTSYSSGQVCGVTSTFSPFAVGAQASLKSDQDVQAALKRDQDAASARASAEHQLKVELAINEVTKKVESGNLITRDDLIQCEYPILNSASLNLVNLELGSSQNVQNISRNEILYTIKKYQLVEEIGASNPPRIYSGDLLKYGVTSSEIAKFPSIIHQLLGLPSSARNSLGAIRQQIDLLLQKKLARFDAVRSRIMK